ncbi:hypothetical protein Tco_0283713, partial [Tanacetum coccineum]
MEPKKPIMMDTMIANICYKGVGNFEYARVLVEMDAKKEIKREIKIQYRGQNNSIKGSKKLKVVYDWKPPACTKCKVFGLEDRHCKKGRTYNMGKDMLDNGNEDGFEQIKREKVSKFDV